MYGKVINVTFGQAKELLDDSMYLTLGIVKTGHFYYVNIPKLMNKKTKEIYYGIYEDEKYVWCLCSNGISKKLNLKIDMVKVYF